MILGPEIHIWISMVLIVGAIGLFVSEKYPLEIASAGIIGVVLLVYQVFPLPDVGGKNLMGAEQVLAGFANPALITVMALLVVGQGLVMTGALDHVADFAIRIGRGSLTVSLILVLVVAMAVSAFLNNTPVVVIFIPIMQAMAMRFRESPSRFMIPLSYAAIFGGMTTLIGSSTNLLASQALVHAGGEPIGFFDPAPIAVIIAVVGLLYMIFIGKYFLAPRASYAGEIVSEGGRQFIAQILVAPGSSLVGEEASAGIFRSLNDLTVRMVQRGEHAELPPFDNFSLRAGDVIIVAGTRKALADLLARDIGLVGPELGEGGEGQEDGIAGKDTILVEGMVTPASRLVGQNLEQSGFRANYNCIVLGIQRRSRMIRARMTEIRLESGDVLLMLARRPDIEALRAGGDVLPMEWSATDVHPRELGRRAALIFVGVVGLSALEITPIVVNAVLGALLMVVAGPLTIRQAFLAMDRQILMVIAASLALGAAMQNSGAAVFLAHGLVDTFVDLGPAAMLSAFFLFVALMTNILSNNACAVLFTPIGAEVARGLGVDPGIFVIAVIIAASCAFATPIGYQTNMLVMGPGHYRFRDFVNIGLPLVLLVWAVFTVAAPLYYGLW